MTTPVTNIVFVPGVANRVTIRGCINSTPASIQAADGVNMITSLSREEWIKEGQLIRVWIKNGCQPVKKVS